MGSGYRLLGWPAAPAVMEREHQRRRNMDDHGDDHRQRQSSWRRAWWHEEQQDGNPSDREPEQLQVEKAGWRSKG